MARLDHRSGQQHHHLRHRDAYRSIRVRSRQPILHGTLREQSVELAKQETMRAKTTKRAGAILLLLAIAVSAVLQVRAQSNPSNEARRPAKHLLQPTIPELAKKLNLTGTVRIEVIIAPDGTVKRSRVLGGHPVLAVEAQRAAEKSTFEPGPKETTEVIEFRF